MTPAGVRELVRRGHEVSVQSEAGAGAGYQDKDYITAGAKISGTAEEIYSSNEMIVKVKEPLKAEYNLIRKDQIIFTYFHFASSLDLTDAMLASGSICITYETVEKADGSLPLLTPMSEIAGRMSVQQGAKYLEKHNGGRGVLLAGVPGVRPANVLVLGAGVVGTNAAKIAAGMGANVTLMDINISRLRQLDDLMPPNVITIFSNEANILEAVRDSELIIGAVLVPGGKAPVLVTKAMLKEMKPGAVVIDVAVDQGGCIETCKPTTHEDPVYTIDGIVHYCVANMPGAVPYSSTQALTNSTLPYILQVADKGWKRACRENNELGKGLNIVKGNLTYASLASTFGKEYTNVADVLS